MLNWGGGGGAEEEERKALFLGGREGGRGGRKRTFSSYVVVLRAADATEAKAKEEEGESMIHEKKPLWPLERALGHHAPRTLCIRR